MDDIKSFVRQETAEWSVRKNISKSSDLYVLSSAVISSITCYFENKNFGRDEAEKILEESISIFEDLVYSLSPFRESIADPEVFWEHQFVPDSVFEGRYKPVLTFNGSFHDSVASYISNPAMHSEVLTRRLIDIYLYEDLISAVSVYTKSSSIKFLGFLGYGNSQGVAVRNVILGALKFTVAFITGFFVYGYDVSLLTPYLMLILFIDYNSRKRHKVVLAQFCKLHEVNSKCVNRYKYSPSCSFNADFLLSDLTYCNHKYGLYFHNNVYDLIDILKFKI